MLIYMNIMIIVALSFFELKANKITMYCEYERDRKDY